MRGGGHNVAGRAVTDGGLMIDLASMRGIHVDPARRRVRVQPGVTWAEYNRTAAVHGLATTGGVISTTGVAGLTLGGGVGWLMGRQGLAVDHLVSAEVVLADGSVVTAGGDGDADLGWALRGGGGNFGVVTSFEFDAHPLATVVGGVVGHPFDAAAETFAAYRDITATAGDDLTVFCGLVGALDGSGEKMVALPVCHAGPEATATAEVDALRRLGTPVLDFVGPMAYPVVNTLLDDAFPWGALNYWRSAFFTELSDEAVAQMVACFAEAPSPMSTLVVEHFHGAATRVEPTATAYPHRRPGYNLAIAGQWQDPAATEANVAWVRDTFAALEPFMAPRVYVNYLGEDEAGRVRDAYGPNWDRLVELKGRYDPANLFRLNQNIAPEG